MIEANDRWGKDIRLSEGVMREPEAFVFIIHVDNCFHKCSPHLMGRFYLIFTQFLCRHE